MDEGQVQKIEINNKKFSWKRILKTVGIIVLIFSLLASVYFVLNLRPVKIWLVSGFLNESENFLPCSELPFYVQAERTYAAHLDVIEKMKNLGAFDIGLEKVVCPGWVDAKYTNKAQLFFNYYTRKQRKAIEKLIGDNFFGIPYRGENH